MEEILNGISTKDLRKKAKVLGLMVKNSSREELYQTLLNYYSSDVENIVLAVKPKDDERNCLSLFNSLVDVRNKIITDNKLIADFKEKINELEVKKSKYILEITYITNELFSKKYALVNTEDFDAFTSSHS